MRSTRLTLAVAALSTALLFSGCSGEDEPEEAAPPGAPTGSPVPEPKTFERSCNVTVQAMGAVEASWEGKGRVTDEAGPTVYAFVEGPDSINVYAGNGDIATNANLTIGGETYTTTSGEGLDVAPNGSAARVDVDTEGVDGAGPHVIANFQCQK